MEDPKKWWTSYWVLHPEHMVVSPLARKAGAELENETVGAEDLSLHCTQLCGFCFLIFPPY